MGLYARWKVDALNLKPDLISIPVGVNDTLHHFNYKNGMEPQRYDQVYRMLLTWTQSVLPDTRLVLMEPFVLPCGAVGSDWLGEMDERRGIVRDTGWAKESIPPPPVTGLSPTGESKW